MLIDTHSHLFLEEFSEDLPQVMERARKAGVSHIFMPNIDSMTIEPMLSVCADYPDLCYPMIGLHPTSVNETYERELAIVRERLSAPNNFVAIGEIGLDLYWDKTFLNEQLFVLEKQIEWALEYNFPIVIHSREAFDYIYKVMKTYKNTPLTGIFHSFTGRPMRRRSCWSLKGLCWVLTEWSLLKSQLCRTLCGQFPWSVLCSKPIPPI